MNSYTGKVAAVVIPKSDKARRFLIAKRSDNGDWEFPGGKQHEDETLLETAEREIEEELDIEIKAEELSEEDSYRAGGYEIIPVFAEILEKHYNIELIDHTDHRWIKPEKVEEMSINLDNEKKCLEAFDLI